MGSNNSGRKQKSANWEGLCSEFPVAARRAPPTFKRCSFVIISMNWEAKMSKWMLLLLGALAPSLFGADWPQLRGPNGSGLCPLCGKLPTEFGPQKNVLWKTELAPGKSSPVLVEDRIFLTACEGDELMTIS